MVMMASAMMERGMAEQGTRRVQTRAGQSMQGRRRHGLGLAESLVEPALCLDFANTVGTHDGTSPYDYLSSYADLAAWGHDAGVLTEQDAAALRQQAARRPAEADASLHAAIALREAIYRLFSSRIRRVAPSDADLATLNGALASAIQQMRLASASNGVAWEWIAREESLDLVLWPVAASAAALMASTDAGNVKECAGRACAWLFLDTTKNHSRRYCRAEGCGNRARARRHYARTRAAGATRG